MRLWHALSMDDLGITHKGFLAIRRLFNGGPRPDGVSVGTWQCPTAPTIGSGRIDGLEAQDVPGLLAAKPRLLAVLDLMPDDS